MNRYSKHLTSTCIWICNGYFETTLYLNYQSLAILRDSLIVRTNWFYALQKIYPSIWQPKADTAGISAINWRSPINCRLVTLTCWCVAECWIFHLTTGWLICQFICSTVLYCSFLEELPVKDILLRMSWVILLTSKFSKSNCESVHDHECPMIT